MQFINGRFEIGPTDNFGGIYRPINTNGVTSVQVEYDANVTPANSGQNNTSILMNTISNYNAGYAQAGIEGRSSQMFTIMAGAVPPSTLIPAPNTFVSANFGDYHIKGLYQDGQFSLTGTKIGDPSTSFATGVISLPGFKLSSMNDVVLYQGTTDGVPAWMDNVKITTTLATPTCTSPQVLQNGACVTLPPPPPTCTSPQVLQGNVCVTPPPPTCTSPQVLQNGACVTLPPPPPTCTSPQVLQGNVCVTPPPPTCTSPQVLQNGGCVTPTPPLPTCTLPQVVLNNMCVTPTAANPFLSPTAKQIYAIYLDLWKQVKEELDLIGDAGSIVTGNAANLVKVILNRVFSVTVEELTKSTADPRDDAALEIANRLSILNDVFRVLSKSNPKGFQFTVALAMAQGSVDALVKVSEVLAKDPPRYDFDQVRTPSITPTISTTIAGYQGQPLLAAEVDVINCSNEAIDGLQVALLAAERAWGASKANALGAIAAQNVAYAAGINKANLAIQKCESAISNIRDQLPVAGIPNLDLSTIPASNSAINPADLEAIRQALLDTGDFSADDIDAALVLALADPSNSGAGFLYGRVDSLQSAFASVEPLNPSLQIPEPDTLTLLLAALGLMAGYSCRRESRRAHEESEYAL